MGTIARRDLNRRREAGGGRDVESAGAYVALLAATVQHRSQLNLATRNRAREEERLRELRTELVGSVLAAVPGAVPYGAAECDRLPGIANIGFPGCSADAILMLLDAAGIDCSTGAACSAGVSQPSHVLLAMGCRAAEARSALRFSLGHTSIRADVKALVAELPEAVQRAKAAAAFA